MTGAVVIRRQNKLMRRFSEAGATDPASARRLIDLGVRNSWIFRRMVARQIFRTTDDDRYYIDTAAAEMFVQ